MLTTAIGVLSFVVGFGVRHAIPIVYAIYKSHIASKAVANAKALIAAEQARVAALEKAKAVVAAAPATPGATNAK